MSAVEISNEEKVELNKFQKERARAVHDFFTANRPAPELGFLPFDYMDFRDDYFGELASHSVLYVWPEKMRLELNFKNAPVYDFSILSSDNGIILLERDMNPLRKDENTAILSLPGEADNFREVYHGIVEDPSNIESKLRTRPSQNTLGIGMNIELDSLFPLCIEQRQYLDSRTDCSLEPQLMNIGLSK